MYVLVPYWKHKLNVKLFVCAIQSISSDYNICTNIMDYLKNLHKALKFAKQLKVLEDSFNNRSSVSTASAANITVLTPFSPMTKYQSYSTTPFSVTNHLICKIDKNRIQSVINRFNIQNRHYNNNSRNRTNIERTSATRLIRELKNILSTVNTLKYKYIKAKKLARCKCCKLIGNNIRNKKIRNRKYCYTSKQITKIISNKIDKLLEKRNPQTAVKQNVDENSSLNTAKDLNKTDQSIVTANCTAELTENIVQADVDKTIGIHQDMNSKSALSPKNKKTKDNIKENNDSELIMPAKKINNSQLVKSQEIMEENELETVENILKEINQNIRKPMRTINEKLKSSQQDKINATESKSTNKNWIKFNSAIEQTDIIKSQRTNDHFKKPLYQPITSKVPKKRAKINDELLDRNVSQMNPSQQSNEQKMYDICKKVELWKHYGTPWLDDFAHLYEPNSYAKPNEFIFEASSIDESVRDKEKPKEENNCAIQQNAKKMWQSPNLSPINAN